MTSVPEPSRLDGAQGSAPRRRNGRQQACEPCRKRKVACDHQLPVCSRCRRGNIMDSCIYVIDQQPQKRLKFTPPASPSPRLATQPPTELPRDFSPQPDNNVGYLGATSFSAVFQDTQTVLPQSARTPEQAEDLQFALFEEHPSSRSLSILRSIPDRATCSALFKLNVNPIDGWCRLAAQILNESLWITFGHVLEGTRTQANLTTMARILCRNSSTPLQEEHTDPIAWLRSFSGQKMRWESLGLLFCYWALGTKSLPENAELRETQQLRDTDRRRLLNKYTLGAGMCVDICKNGSTANSLLAILLYRYGIIQSIISGDASIQFWRIHGELAALTSFLGLHVTPPSMINDHSISSEMKRRLYSMIFKSDKVVATFTGRPPLIGSRFATTPLPLDVSDEELLNSDGNSLANSPNVDEHGWNNRGKIFCGTMMRAKMILTLIKEQILEIALQITPSGDTDQVLNDLRRRELEALDRFPKVLIYRDTDINDPDTDGPTLYARVMIRLDHLQNMFFIERLLSKGSSVLGSEIIDISFEMISLTLIFWTHQEKLFGVSGDSEWLLMCYAAPAAGILCMELLRGRGSVATTPSRSNSTNPPITRSRLIQQLSLLVGFLDWVGPMAPNTESCSSVKKAVRHVLDQALNEGAPQVTAPMDWVGDFGVGFSGDMNDFFNFELLHTFDWLRPDGQ
ncbi:Transcription factor, fungi [Metarhizium guizhouense ARSEF 977]|uniref:Transcription factor, fungi n=1 Tax=Metarhizium guizhouense (strain ARSEF 977) TaxID=1276136 RepID=A0A0B4H187_METGA|nr:Transcription factor, fungi [Metarhizium guizhouense ARSEF 977]